MAALIAVLLAAACAHAPPGGPSAPTADTPRYVSDDYDLAFAYAPQLRVSGTFEADYFLGTRWNPDAPAGVPGDALLSLTLPQSDPVRRAVLRLGASRDPRALADCSLPAADRSAARGDVRTARIDGVAFERVDTHDAAMNHYSHVHSYRAVTHGRCIAIDLIVTGVNPAVYDPPPTPPFTVDAAFGRLESLLAGLELSPR